MSKKLKNTFKNKERKIKQEKHNWEKPILEDVSEKIMAQPYIRFT